MDDIVEQLRRSMGHIPFCGEAAAEIARLRAEVDRLRNEKYVYAREEIERLRAEVERLTDRVWLLRTMCHCEKCTCADRGGAIHDYDMCRIVSRHANAVRAAFMADGKKEKE